MFRTSNMGWGFAIVVSRADADEATDDLEQTHVHAQQIGSIVGSEGIKILCKSKRIILK